MRRKHALLIAFAVIISILISNFTYSLLISCFIWFARLCRPKPPLIYEKTIVRNTGNIQEANALAIAENSNYSNIFSLRRFTRHGNETWAYVWANFIDTHVIEYYGDRYENLKGKLGDGGDGSPSIMFHYEANVSAWDQIRVVYVPAPQGARYRYSDAIRILSSNGSVLFENAELTGLRWVKFAYWNGSECQRITAEEINFSLAKSYVIEMMLDYDEIWGPLAGFGVRVYQIIIVDQYFVPLLFCIQSEHAIS